MYLSLSTLSVRWGYGAGVQALKSPDTQDNTKLSSNGDLVKLFNDAQQNILQLNKQRLMAVEQLQKSERDRELLLARVAQLEAENQIAAAERDVLQEKLRSQELLSLTQGWGGQKDSKTVTPSVWSELLLQIDALAMSGAIKAVEAKSLRRLVISRDLEAAEHFSKLSSQTIVGKDLARGLLALLDPNYRRKLHIVHICTEMHPIAVSGNLASFITSLGRALQRKGHFVEVFLPKYKCLDLSQVVNLKEIKADLYSFFGGTFHKNKLWTGTVQGIAVTFFEPLHSSGWFSRSKIYDYEDDFERFSYFCRVSLEYLLKSGKQPNVLHLHNWQTALVAPLFWDMYASQGLESTRIVFTCHNFKYQCLQEPERLALCGLDPFQLHRPDRFQDNTDSRSVNILKGAIVYSNKVTTVSPTYAKDLTTPEYGHGLDSTLLCHMNKFVGIYNGLDSTIWNPAIDGLLPFTYSVDDLSGKARCKIELRQLLSLPASDVEAPLVSCIVQNLSELELSLVKATLDVSLASGVQFVFVGASKSPRIQLILEDLQRDCKTLNAVLALKYNDALVHLLVAASDILVCASVTEPTDQSPQIAMKYGAIPVARKIGGQQCSVIDANETNQDASKRTGFTFYANTASEVASALRRALEVQRQTPELWATLQRNGMERDVSWDSECVDAYISAYRSLVP